MQYEIERKYLVKQLPDGIYEHSGTPLEQAYIFSEPEMRIRRSGDKYYLTVKSKGDSLREEYEMEISSNIFDMFKIHLETPFVRKTRYKYPLNNGLMAEIDVYLDFENLITVDVEFASIDSMNAFVPPDWFGEDISGQYEYRNRTLAMMLVK